MVLRHLINHCSSKVVSSICLIVFSMSNLQANESCNYDYIHTSDDGYESVLDLLNALKEGATVSEVIDCLEGVRNNYIKKGYPCPSLIDMAREMYQYFMSQGVLIEDLQVQALMQEMLRRDQAEKSQINHSSLESSYAAHCRHHRHHRHHDDKRKKDKKDDVKLSGKCIFGFIKCLTGGLITILPFPGAQSAGIAIIVLGVNDMIDGSRENGDENERIQKLEKIIQDHEATLREQNP